MSSQNQTAHDVANKPQKSTARYFDINAEAQASLKPRPPARNVPPPRTTFADALSGAGRQV